MTGPNGLPRVAIVVVGQVDRIVTTDETRIRGTVVACPFCHERALVTTVARRCLVHDAWSGKRLVVACEHYQAQPADASELVDGARVIFTDPPTAPALPFTLGGFVS